MVGMSGEEDAAGKSAVDGYLSGSSSVVVTPIATPRSGYNSSFAGTPTPRSPAPPPRSPTSPGSLLFSHILQHRTVRKSSRLSDEDDLHHSHQAYYYDETVARLSNTSTPRAGFNLSIPGPILTTASDFDSVVAATGLAADVEAARHQAMMDRCNDVDSVNPVDNLTAAACEKPPLPVTLKFVDVQYEVISRSSGCAKRILQGITGLAAPGEMLAMLGPSGSGKTTFLNVLAARTPSSHSSTSGTITYNGLPFTKHLKTRMGFVTQDDVLYPHLTVRETLMYAGLLRLPRHYTRHQKMERANTVLEQLGLQKCANTVIGGAFLRGVSGGERKRVCIGHEILIDPSLLLLDEPTSGLDSSTALRLMHLLKGLAQGGRTVITTIHQPSSRMFHMFHKLIMLSEGHSLYVGPATEAVGFFENLGFRALVTMNPAEFLLDLCSGNTNDISLPDSLTQMLEALHSKRTEPKPTAKTVKQYLVDVCENKKEMKDMALKMDPSHHMTPTCVMDEEDSPIGRKPTPAYCNRYEWNTSWWQQFIILLSRGLKERRHEYLSSLRILQVLASAIIGGFLWWQSKLQTTQDLQDQTGLLFFLAMYWGYLPLVTAIFTFPLERAVLMKERASNMYRLSAYFVARTVGDLPLDMMMPVVFLFIIYFMAHLRYTIEAFFLTLLTIFLIVITAQGLGLLIGAALMDVKKATTLASVLFITFVLVGGFVVQHLPRFINWVKYVSFQNYAFTLLIKVQYPLDQTFDCGPLAKGCREIASSPALHGVTLGGGGKEVCILLAMSLGFRLFAYLALRHMKTSL